MAARCWETVTEYVRGPSLNVSFVTLGWLISTLSQMRRSRNNPMRALSKKRVNLPHSDHIVPGGSLRGCAQAKICITANRSGDHVNDVFGWGHACQICPI